MTYDLHRYYALKYIIGTKDGIPVLLLFNDNYVLKISQNNKEIITSIDIVSTCIDTIYLMFYDHDRK